MQGHDEQFAALEHRLRVADSARVDNSSAVEATLLVAIAALKEDMLRRFNGVSTVLGQIQREVSSARDELSKQDDSWKATTERLDGVAKSLAALSVEVLGECAVSIADKSDGDAVPAGMLKDPRQGECSQPS